MSRELCNSHAANIKRVAGWTFAHMFNFYFGESTIIFEEADCNNQNIKLAITDKWLEENHVLRFGLNDKLIGISSIHTSQCSGVECVNAEKMITMVQPFFGKGKIPGGPELILVSTYSRKDLGEETCFSRANGFGESMDEILPFIRWFTDDKDFWNWPK